MKPGATAQTLNFSGQVLALLVLATAALLVLVTPVGAQRMPESFADLAEKTSPAVVNITTSTTIAGLNEIPRPMVPEGSPLEDFFKDFMDRQRGQNRPRRSNALGSGFIISADGYIVTNNHVIDKADEIVIELFDSGEELEAEIVGRDPKTDIALLKVTADKPLPFVSFGDSDGARVGDWVMAVGNPLGQGFSVSAGIISARNRTLSGAYDDFIQTDAAINRGNSGGPLFNLAGEVIGVNTAILSPNGGSIGIGFSMASNVVASVVEQLRDFGETRRGWLGVRIQNVTPDVAEALGLDKPSGALVTDVPDGPAAEGGIKAGDVILSFDGQDVASSAELVRIVGDSDVGATVRVVVFREGKTKTLKVTLGRLEEAEVVLNATDRGKSAPPPQRTVLGMTLGALTEETRSRFSVEPNLEGVLVLDVGQETAAHEKGMRPGDVITEVAQSSVRTPAEVEKRIKVAREAGRKSILLLVRRDGQPRFVALSLEE
ncbi:MAG: DegQ family serine endoprotease [Paracoccaceae bacterium]